MGVEGRLWLFGVCGSEIGEFWTSPKVCLSAGLQDILESMSLGRLSDSAMNGVHLLPLDPVAVSAVHDGSADLPDSIPVHSE